MIDQLPARPWELLAVLAIGLAITLVHRITTWQEYARRSMNTPGVRAAF